MKILHLGKNNYEIVKNNKDCIDEEELKSLFTEYFETFDYVLGDYSYGRLRLKGFYDSKIKLVKDYNNYNNLDKYLEENCAVDAKYFVIRKISWYTNFFVVVFY